MHFGDKTTKEEAFHILDYALDLGINMIDTANVYNDGRAETIIGEWLAQNPSRRDKVIIATKFHGHLSPRRVRRGERCFDAQSAPQPGGFPAPFADQLQPAQPFL